jgi:hypothetical protein
MATSGEGQRDDFNVSLMDERPLSALRTFPSFSPFRYVKLYYVFRDYLVHLTFRNIPLVGASAFHVIVNLFSATLYDSLMHTVRTLGIATVLHYIQVDW